MIYLAHFTFKEVDQDGEERQGRFNYLVEAKAPQKALETMEKQLRIAMEKHQFFEGKRVAIYIDGVIEVEKVPRNGILTHYEISEDIVKSLVGADLPLCKSKWVKVLDWYPDGQEPPSDDRLEPIPAFMVFE